MGFSLEGPAVLGPAGGDNRGRTERLGTAKRVSSSRASPSMTSISERGRRAGSRGTGARDAIAGGLMVMVVVVGDVRAAAYAQGRS